MGPNHWVPEPGHNEKKRVWSGILNVCERAGSIRSQEYHESGLLKVMVGSERLSDAALLHGLEAGAIDQSPLLIGSCGIVAKRLLKAIGSGWLHVRLRRTLQLFRHFGGLRPNRRAFARKAVEDLRQHQIACNHPNLAQALEGLDCPVMKSILWVQQGDQETGICKDLPHGSRLPAP